MEKFFIKLDNNSLLGIMYDSRPGKCILTIGGNAKLRRFIESIAVDYFNMDVFGIEHQKNNNTPKIEERWVQINKLRFIGKIPRTQFLNGLDKIKNHGINITETTALGRVMR